MTIPIVIDLRLLTFAEHKVTKHDLKKEHVRLHKLGIKHIHNEDK